MNKEMPPERELITFPSYNGYSIGCFEGDTLVIESAGFKGDVTSRTQPAHHSPTE
jgi:hypothetical protein